MKEAIIILCSYLAGSVNFAILLFRVMGKGDPRVRFSGNAGVTNVKRQAGTAWAGVVLLLDVGRSVGIAALALYVLDDRFVTWAGLALILGNTFPVFHGFKGGKGVANYLGFTAFLAPVYAALSCLVWVAVYGITRAPFIASFCMTTVMAGGTVILFSHRPLSTAGTALTFLLIIINHRKNIIEAVKQ